MGRIYRVLLFLIVLMSTTLALNAQEVLKVQGRQGIIKYNSGLHYVEIGDILEVQRNRGPKLKVEQKGESFLLVSISDGDLNLNDRVRLRGAPDELGWSGEDEFRKHHFSLGLSSMSLGDLQDEGGLLAEGSSASGLALGYFYQRTAQWGLGLSFISVSGFTEFDPLRVTSQLGSGGGFTEEQEVTLTSIDLNLRRNLFWGTYLEAIVGVATYQLEGEYRFSSSEIAVFNFDVMGVTLGLGAGLKRSFGRFFVEGGAAFLIHQYLKPKLGFDGEEEEALISPPRDTSMAINARLGFSF